MTSPSSLRHSAGWSQPIGSSGPATWGLRPCGPCLAVTHGCGRDRHTLTDMPHHDLVIIGSGSGNSLLTPELDGLDVAMVEAGTFGGTCLNVGCIPTKMFVVPADRVVDADDAARLGVAFPVPEVDWPGIRDRIFGRIDPISAAGEAYRRTQDDVRCMPPARGSPGTAGCRCPRVSSSPQTGWSWPPGAGPWGCRSPASRRPTRRAACTPPTRSCAWRRCHR